MVELKYKAHCLVAVGRQFNIVFIKDFHAIVEKQACRRAVKGTQDVKQGGFAGPGSTDNGNHFALQQLQIQAFQDINPVADIFIVFFNTNGLESSWFCRCLWLFVCFLHANSCRLFVFNPQQFLSLAVK